MPGAAEHTTALEIVPFRSTLGITFGAEVRVDLRQPLDEESFRLIEQAWFEHAVLVFRRQDLDEEEHIAFSRRFGRLERSIRHREGVAPEIALLSNVRSDGTLIEPEGKYALFLKGNTYWHTDSSFKRIPAKGSMLAARVVPSSGGETEFADMRAAWDALEPALQERLQGCVAVHSYRYSQGLVGGLDVLTPEELDALPPVEHPVVRTNPDSGRRSLFIGRHASHIVGEDLEESRALLGRLCQEACQPPRVYVHRWRPGDLVLWDNRSVLHRGRPWPPDEPRVMARTTLAGDDPGNEWAL